MFLFVIVLLLSCLIIFIKKSTSYWNQRNITGPKPMPIFGNIMESFLRQKPLANIYHDIYNDFSDEKVVGIYTMTTPALLIRDLEIVKQILVKDFSCFSERVFTISKKKLGDSLFHCDEKTWRALKGKLTPYFSRCNLKSSFNSVLECGTRLVEHIEKVNQITQEQELHHLFRKFGIDTTLSGLFSLNIDTVYDSDNDDFWDKLDKSIFTKSYLSEMSMFSPNFMDLTNTSIFGEIAVKFCNDIVKNATNQRKDTVEYNNILNMLLDLKDKGKASMDEMNNNDFKMTDHVIASQVLILFATGYESANLSLSYAFYHIAQNIDVQDKLIEQINRILMKHNGLLTYDALNEITYLEQVLSETLRLNHFTNTLQRVAMVNYTIPGTNIEIEKGVTVLISPLAIHRDAKYYKDPLTFDPERFNPENKIIRNPCAYLPFGLGPRSCFGYRFTKLVFKVAMVKILSKFTVRPSEKIRNQEIDPYRTMLAIKEGIHLNILLRKKPLIC